MGRLAGKVAIVTGAAQGIGVHYAKALAAEGAKVVVSDIIETDAVVKSIKQSGGEAIGIRTDVAKWSDCVAMVEKTVAGFGRIDVLVSNAALFTAVRRGRITDITEEEWDRVMAVNARGVFFCCKAVIPEMAKAGGGSIINVSSSTVAMGITELIHYVSSKGAVEAFTRCLAREVGELHIRVNAIAPGLTLSEKLEEKKETITRSLDMQRGSRCLKRDQYPEDLVGTVVFLASSDSGFMTGQSLIVDGGGVMR